MLQHLLQIITLRNGTETNDKGVTEFLAEMTDGEILICPANEMVQRLAETRVGLALLNDFEIEFHRFGNKITVVHMYHLPTDTSYLGRSISPSSGGFNRKRGQEIALRDAIRQFIPHELYRLKWLAQDSQRQTKT